MRTNEEQPGLSDHRIQTLHGSNNSYYDMFQAKYSKNMFYRTVSRLKYKLQA